MKKENLCSIAPKISKLVEYVDKYEGTDSLQDILDSLSDLQSDPIFCPNFLQANKEALLSNDWSPVEKLMNDGFFSDAGLSLVVSPYRVWRPGVKTRLSLLICEKMDNVAAFPFDYPYLNSRYGAVVYTPVIPINVLASAGNIGGDSGETFIVPTAWTLMPGASSASPYIDVYGSQRRVSKTASDGYLQALCDPALAKKLIDFRSNTISCMASRYQEYSLHEYGHAVGQFVKRISKIWGGMERAAFEEWRCDGIMAQLVTDHVKLGHIDKATGQKILMSNFMTRFGMDIARNKGQKDHDFLASYFILSCFLETKLVKIKDHRFHFEGDVNNFEAWKAAYSFMAETAERVSRNLDNGDAVMEHIPQSGFSIDDFSTLVQRALKMSALQKRADQVNDNVHLKDQNRRQI